MKKQTFKIRYNTAATSDKNCWRVISDGEEILVDGISVSGNITTTKDFMEDINQFKYHITCTGVLEIKDNIAYITSL
jgi:hypothetical protein